MYHMIFQKELKSIQKHYSSIVERVPTFSNSFKQYWVV